MIYGASTHKGKKLLNHALTLSYKPILADPSGQDLVELSFQTGLPCSIFSLTETKKIQFFLKDVSCVVLCKPLHSGEHKRLLKACLLSGVHYIDISKDLFSYERVLNLNSRFQNAGLTAIPGLHPSVILSDFVASSLKSRLHDINSLTLACSESFSSLISLINNLQRGGRILHNSKLCKPNLIAETLLVPFHGQDTLTVSTAQADILTAWQSTRIPNIHFFGRTGEKEVRFRKNFQRVRWLLHFPFFRKLLASQENFLIRHFGIKPFYPEKYAVWGKARNAQGQSLSMSIEIVDDFDIALDAAFKVLEKLLAGDLRKGLLTVSQILGPSYWLESEHLNLSIL
jgi:short subunit dehydrogenase-like uncharacterized protein